MESTYLCRGNNVIRPQRMKSSDKVMECAALCASTQGCEGWTLGYVRWCWIKSSMDCRGTYPGWTSGAKACGQP